MAAVFSMDVQQIASAVSVPLATETLVLVGFPCTLPSTSGKAAVRATITIQTGQPAVNVTINIYRGTTLSGTLIQATTQNFPASSPTTPQFAMEASCVDPVANISQAQYCVSVTVTGGGAGPMSVLAATIQTTMLSG